MIEINLLPPELRRTQGTAPRILALGIGAVVLLVALVMAYLWLWLTLLVLEQERTDLGREVKAKQAKAQQLAVLREDIRQYKDRERSIVQIKANRILWSRKLDELVRLTPEDVWIVSLKVVAAQSQRGKVPRAVGENGYLELHCYAIGDKVTPMTEFRRRLKGERPFWAYFLQEPIALNDFSYGFSSISQPSWDTAVLKGFRKEKNIEFTIRLNLKPMQISGTGGKKTS